MLGTIVTPGNIQDSHILQPLVEKVIEKVKKPLAVAADAAYKTPAITNFLLENQMLPVLPYTRLKTKSAQAMLTFAAINLKKLATWTWQGA